MKQISIYGVMIGSLIVGSSLANADDHCIDQPTGQLQQQQLDRMARMEYQNRLREWARSIGIEIEGLEASVAGKDPRLLATSLGIKYRSRLALTETHDEADERIGLCSVGDRASESHRPGDRTT